MLRPPLLLALLAALAAPAAAQEELVLEEIVVEGGAEDEGVATDVPAAVTVITRAQIDEDGGETIAEVLQKAPGVTAPTSADDPATAVNIRGLGDFDRVAVTVDGARQNFARSGHAANGGFYVDRDMVKAVEITRGPVSAASGGIGGAVAFTTIDADDVLRDGETVAGRVKTEVESNMPAGLIHGEVATRIGDAFDIVVAGTARNAGDYTDGDGNTVNSAQTLLSGLLKARVRIDDGHETTLSAQRNTNDFDNGIATVRRTEQITDTLVATHRFASPDTPLIDALGRVYYTSTRLDQEDTTGSAIGAERSFDVETVGGEAFNSASFDTWGIANTITVGGDVFHDAVESVDDLNLSSGSTPSGERTVYGAYAQHIAQRGWFELRSALRYDGYNLTGTNEYTSPPQTVDRTEGRLSPKVTLSVTPIDPVTVYASYSEGLRAPSITETLVQGFHPPPATFPFLPNPNLDAEVAHNLEAGINLAFDDLLTGGDIVRAKAAAFRNRVDDYIGLNCFAFPLPGGCQYANIPEVELTGVELEAIYDAGFMYAGLTATHIQGNVIKAAGNDADDESTAAIPPDRLSATVGVRLVGGRLDIGGTLTVVDDKKQADVFGLEGTGYGLIDAHASYALDADTTATLTLKNITDREYVQYLNLEPSPGFSAVLTLSTRFGGSPRMF